MSSYKKIFLLISILIFFGIVFYFLKNSGMREKFTISEKNINPAEKQNIEKKPQIKILFVGDMMFDRYIRQVSEKKGADFIFAKVNDLFQLSDLVVGNLEGPITDNKSVSVNSEFGSKNNYIFTFDPGIANVLKNKNIGLVNIGNNHIENFGSSGLESTRKYLNSSGVDYFGDPENKGNESFIKNFDGFRIAFVSYNQFEINGKRKALDAINKVKKENPELIFMYTHWGKEFLTEPQDDIKKLAYEFIDAGADLIIGSHPHVVQGNEEYKGKNIFYSLGNFIFDQYFDLKTREGKIVQIMVDTKTKKVTFLENKVEILNSGQTVLKK
jgi:poly-gamma-glutamate synthesis protein (capsule biosynthesis protein)